MNFHLDSFIELFRWKAKVKKLEKDVDRHKFGSTQMLERNEQLVKEMENIKTQNVTLREQVSRLESELNDAHVRRSLEIFSFNLLLDYLDNTSSIRRTFQTK